MASDFDSLPESKKTIEMQKHFSFKITKVEKENTKLSRILDSQQRNFNELKLENSVLRKKYSELEEKYFIQESNTNSLKKENSFLKKELSDLKERFFARIKIIEDKSNLWKQELLNVIARMP